MVIDKVLSNTKRAFYIVRWGLNLVKIIFNLQRLGELIGRSRVNIPLDFNTIYDLMVFHSMLCWWIIMIIFYGLLPSHKANLIRMLANDRIFNRKVVTPYLRKVLQLNERNFTTLGVYLLIIEATSTANRLLVHGFGLTLYKLY